MDKVIITIASTDDAHEIACLNLLFNEATDPAEAIAARMNDPACVETVILAKFGREVVGFALVRVVPCVLYEDHHAELTELYVMDAYRKRGIAGKLLSFAEKIAIQKGAQSILVQTGDENVAALSLYRKHGYMDYDLTLKKRLI